MKNLFFALVITAISVGIKAADTNCENNVYADILRMESVDSALENYDIVLDDAKSTEDMRVNALKKSRLVYLNAHEIARAVCLANTLEAGKFPDDDDNK